MNIGVARKQNIDGNQNDAQFSHVLCFKRFFSSQILQMCLICIHSESLFSSLQYFNHSKQKRIHKKMNASLPVVRKCHRDLSFVNATDALPSSVRMCNSAVFIQRTHATNTITKSIHKASRSLVCSHTFAVTRCVMIVYRKKKVDAALYTNRVYG